MHQLVSHVDGSAHERMIDAKLATRGKLTPVGQLEGLLPIAQEFHKRMLKIQVSNIFNMIHYTKLSNTYTL